MNKLPPMATQQLDAANRITNSALHHAKIAVQVQLETTQAMLDDNIALATSISHGMQSGNLQEVAQALAQAAQQNVQRYMAQSQRLAELSRKAQTEAIDAVPLPYDTARWEREFLSNWPAGSPGHQSYFQRIRQGPRFTPKQAFARPAGLTRA